MRLTGLLMLVALAAGINVPPADSAQQGELITFGAKTCAPGWRVLGPGPQRFRVQNASSVRATVYLFNAASGNILTTLSGVAPGTTRAITVQLTGGATYSWGCDLAGYPVHLSDAETAPKQSQPGGSGAVVPVYAADLIPALDSYRSYVTKLLTRLHAQVQALSTVIAGGSLPDAKTAWLTAHLTWLRIGQDDGAYGAFGNLGGAIDGSAGGIVGGVKSPSFTGFHRIELDLWRRSSLTAAAKDTRRLSSLLAQLRRQPLRNWLPATTLGLTNFTLRCHEILEDALRDSLSADDDYGSGTDLASLTADVAATREFLSIFGPLIEPRSRGLVGTAEVQLTAVLRAVAGGHHGDRWTPIAALPTIQRLRIDAAVDAALQTLAPVSELLALGNAP